MANQNPFAHYLTQLIKELSVVSSISGFLHQLILQVLIEDYFVKKCELFKPVPNSNLGMPTHPRYGTV